MGEIAELYANLDAIGMTSVKSFGILDEAMGVGAVIADVAKIGKSKDLPRRRGDTENSQGQKIGTPGESKGSQYFQPEGPRIANLAWSDVSS